jgi:hypothetical protein
MPAPKNNKNALGNKGNTQKDYSTQDIELILNRFADGEKLKDILKEKGMPSNGTLLRYIHNNVEFQKLYARAREFHGDQFNNEIEEIKSELKEGKLTANEARTLADIVKWQAAKFYPKMYGDKVEIDHSSKDGTMSPNLSNLSNEELEKRLNLVSKLEKK